MRHTNRVRSLLQIANPNLLHIVDGIVGDGTSYHAQIQIIHQDIVGRAFGISPDQCRHKVTKSGVCHDQVVGLPVRHGRFHDVIKTGHTHGAFHIQQSPAIDRIRTRIAFIARRVDHQGFDRRRQGRRAELVFQMLVDQRDAASGHTARSAGFREAAVRIGGGGCGRIGNRPRRHDIGLDTSVVGEPATTRRLVRPGAHREGVFRHGHVGHACVQITDNHIAFGPRRQPVTVIAMTYRLHLRPYAFMIPRRDDRQVMGLVVQQGVPLHRTGGVSIEKHIFSSGIRLHTAPAPQGLGGASGHFRPAFRLELPSRRILIGMHAEPDSSL